MIIRLSEQHVIYTSVCLVYIHTGVYASAGYVSKALYTRSVDNEAIIGYWDKNILPLHVFHSFESTVNVSDFSSVWIKTSIKQKVKMHWHALSVIAFCSLCNHLFSEWPCHSMWLNVKLALVQ